MAIYHLTAKVISRARGQSVVAAAAYRLGDTLRDERYGITHRYTRKGAVTHSEIMAPTGAPEWVHDRQALWNRVEAGERRKDAQLARAVQIGLPLELSHDESVALVRDYVAQEFVSKGMIADFGICPSDANNPHAHILLTLREATPSGFGPKVRHWNRKSDLLEWRAAWADQANRHLARAGHAVRIDHRSLEAQQIELTPGRKIGVGRERQGGKTLPRHLKERVAEQQRIAEENGEAILEDPTAALRAITRQRPIFTHQDLVQYLTSRTEGSAQLEAALLATMQSQELVALGPDGGQQDRFTTRDMLEAEKSLMRRVAAMAVRRHRGCTSNPQAPVAPPSVLTEGERSAFYYLVGEGDLKALAAVAGSGKGALLSAAREFWKAQGVKAKGAAPSRIAAQNLEVSSGIESQTLAHREHEWKEGRDPLTENEVLVIDESEMIGVKHLERILAVADKARAKVVLMGDSRQLEVMGSLSPLQALIAQAGPLAEAGDSGAGA